MNVTAVLQIERHLYLGGIGHSRTKSGPDSGEFPRYLMFNETSVVKVISKKASNTGFYCSSLHKQAGFNMATHPYVFARQSNGIDLLDLRSTKSVTVLVSKEIE